MLPRGAREPHEDPTQTLASRHNGVPSRQMPPSDLKRPARPPLDVCEGYGGRACQLSTDSLKLTSKATQNYDGDHHAAHLQGQGDPHRRDYWAFGRLIEWRRRRGRGCSRSREGLATSRSGRIIRRRRPGAASAVGGGCRRLGSMSMSMLWATAPMRRGWGGC
ncbi:hypothetical protein RJ55_01592 [Drechmeria coniospora]|nr:hypothetical protein RJ55_01592 [Drechmeria coniospora]